MAKSNSETVSNFIDKRLKKAIDDIVYTLENKADIELSPDTQQYLANLSLQFIEQFSKTIISEQLIEPEYFVPNTLNRQV